MELVINFNILCTLLFSQKSARKSYNLAEGDLTEGKILNPSPQANASQTDFPATAPSRFAGINKTMCGKIFFLLLEGTSYKFAPA